MFLQVEDKRIACLVYLLVPNRGRQILCPFDNDISHCIIQLYREHVIFQLSIVVNYSS